MTQTDTFLTYYETFIPVFSDEQAKCLAKVFTHLVEQIEAEQIKAALGQDTQESRAEDEAPG